jgi:hypothetical protein
VGTESKYGNSRLLARFSVSTVLWYFARRTASLAFASRLNQGHTNQDKDDEVAFERDARREHKRHSGLAVADNKEGQDSSRVLRMDRNKINARFRFRTMPPPET